MSETNKTSELTVYKVCRVDGDGNYASCTVSRCTFAVHYKFGERTYPDIKNSCLYAFRTTKDAKAFIRNSVGLDWIGPVHVLKCKAAKYQGHLMICSIASVRQFWSLSLEKRVEYMNNNWFPVPAGTIMCEWVEPAERVFIS